MRSSATASLEESIELWRAEGVPVREGDARRRLSYALWRTCRGPEGLAAANAALAVLEPLGTSRELAWALATSASNEMLREDFETSRAHGARALDLAEQLGLDDVRSDALNTLAVVAAWTGHEWYPMLHESLAVALRTGHHTQAARAYINRDAVAPGRRAVVFAANDESARTALDLTNAGVDVQAESGKE